MHPVAEKAKNIRFRGTVMRTRMHKINFEGFQARSTLLKEFQGPEFLPS